jgi:glutamate formiminotransferase
MLECVINISEGRRHDVIRALQSAAGASLLDTHTDPDHNRSVFTLGGDDVLDAAIRLARSSIELVDLRNHVGVHPRLGVVDVVPFVPISGAIGPDMDLAEALAARQGFAEFAAKSLGIPCFFYGPERTLPEIRRRAFVDIAPDLGPPTPDPKSGAICVGARLPLVAYNLVLEEPDLQAAKFIARQLRSPAVRALGLAVGNDVQVSCNLIAPWSFGPAECYDAVRAVAPIKSAELVGLLAEELLARIPPNRYAELDVDPDRTIESRLRRSP